LLRKLESTWYRRPYFVDFKRNSSAGFPKHNNKSIGFFYDLTANPITYDFSSFLFSVEIKRKQLGLTFIDIFFVLPTWSSVVQNKTDPDETEHRLFEILLGVTRLLPSVRYRSILGRDACLSLVSGYQHRWPHEFSCYSSVKATLLFPKTSSEYFPLIKLPSAAITRIEQYLRRFPNKKILTVTLRNSQHIPSRNSSVSDWMRFEDWLGDEYQVIYLPDAEYLDCHHRQALGEREVFEAGCANVVLRAALYHCAFANLGVVSGPINLALCDHAARTLVFYNVDAYPVDYWRNIMRTYGHRIGDQEPYHTDAQRFAYVDDSFENLRAEYLKFKKIIFDEKI